MPFVSVTILKRHLGARLVESFQTANPTVFERQLIPVADRLITRHTGIPAPDVPEEEPDGDSPDVQLQMYAAWIIHFLMIQNQGGVDAEEYRNRERQYERAQRELAAFSAGAPVSNAFTAAGVASQSGSRVGDLP